MSKIRVLKKGGIKWIDGANLDVEKKKEILKNYNFHELDIEACLEDNQFPRVNKSNDYIFMILHFPKYIQSEGIYIQNEFDIFLGKDYLITFRDYPSSHVNKIFDIYEKLEQDTEKINPGYMLYKVVEVMLEKAYKVIYKQKKDLSSLENDIFSHFSKYEVRHILVKKRNIILLKHIFQPQVYILRQMENALNSFFKGEYELYFEDLEDKIDFIVHQISILYETIENIEDAFRNIVDIRLSRIMTILTAFSTFLLPLTLITSFYGMNIPLPFKDNPYVVYSLMLLCVIITIIIFIFLSKKDNI